MNEYVGLGILLMSKKPYMNPEPLDWESNTLTTILPQIVYSKYISLKVYYYVSCWPDSISLSGINSMGWLWCECCDNWPNSNHFKKKKKHQTPQHQEHCNTLILTYICCSRWQTKRKHIQCNHIKRFPMWPQTSWKCNNNRQMAWSTSQVYWWPLIQHPR